uniref:Uncharacterized protein n=2 Tax=Anguilla anguilla TaxID=7936 RepID=A0A0E9QA49_ANGAN
MQKALKPIKGEL